MDDLERFADSGLPVGGFTRRQALKLGALSLGGAVVAAILPGRLRASGINHVCGPQGGNCNAGFPVCPGSGIGLGCNCYTAAEGHHTCGADSFCYGLAGCNRSTDCKFGYFCAKFTGCDCTGATGVCIKTCGTGATPVAKPRAYHRGMTTSGVRR